MIDIYRLHTLIEDKARKNKREYPFHPDWRVPHNGKQKPADPEWALRTVERGISDGFLNIEQAEQLRDVFKPQAEAYAKNKTPPQTAEYKPTQAANGEREKQQTKPPSLLDTVEQTAPVLKSRNIKIIGGRPSPVEEFVETTINGYKMYKQYENLLNEDMRSMEEEEREIYKEYPRNTRDFISENISQGRDINQFNEMAKKNGIIIPKEKFLRLQQIERARRKKQTNSPY